MSSVMKAGRATVSVRAQAQVPRQAKAAGEQRLLTAAWASSHPDSGVGLPWPSKAPSAVHLIVQNLQAGGRAAGSMRTGHRSGFRFGGLDRSIVLLHCATPESPHGCWPPLLAHAQCPPPSGPPLAWLLLPLWPRLPPLVLKILTPAWRL